MNKYIAIKAKASEISDYADRLYHLTNIGKDTDNLPYVQCLKKHMIKATFELHELQGG